MVIEFRRLVEMQFRATAIKEAMSRLRGLLGGVFASLPSAGF